MAEKYRGILPPGSIWYRLTRAESIAYLQLMGLWSELTPEQQVGIEDSDIQALPGKAEEIESLLTQAGLTVRTLFD